MCLHLMVTLSVEPWKVFKVIQEGPPLPYHPPSSSLSPPPPLACLTFLKGTVPLPRHKQATSKSSSDCLLPWPILVTHLPWSWRPFIKTTPFTRPPTSSLQSLQSLVLPPRASGESLSCSCNSDAHFARPQSTTGLSLSLPSCP